MLDQVAQDGVDHLGSVCRDADAGVARVRTANTDLALVDLEASSHLENPIQDLGKKQRVDDVAPNLDLVDGAGG